MNSRWILALGAAAILSGCASSSNLERIATVQNRAEALFAYGGVATFPLSSDVTEISVYAPLRRKHEFAIVPPTREKPLTPAVKEQSRSAGAVTKAQPSKAQESLTRTNDQPSESAQRADAQKETVVASEQAATQVEKPQAADVNRQTLAADTQVSEHQPTFHTKVSNQRVHVGQTFELTMEFENSTPVDLQSVQLTDPVDPRLKLFQKDISVKPDFKHHVSVGNGQVVVRFSEEIKRGKRVRVTIPVMFPATSAASAQ